MCFLNIYNGACIIILALLLFKYLHKRSVKKYEFDQDMTGKTVLITGATSGIGKAAALELARKNARVLLACRNLGKAEKVKQEIIHASRNTNLEVKILDLESFDSVRKCADDILKTEKRLDVLINNAGIIDSTLTMTKHGFQRTMQVNYLSPFLLTLLLLDLLKKSNPSRIINVSSIIHLFSSLDTNDINGAKTNFIKRTILCDSYNRSKLANVLFTRELATRLHNTGVTVNAIHPGYVDTNLFEERSYFILCLKFFKALLAKTPEEGSQPIVHLAAHPGLEKTTGKFFDSYTDFGFFRNARDMKLARQLFEKSEEIVGVSFKK